MNDNMIDEASSMMKNRRGLYAVITGFIFIVIAVVLVIGVIFFDTFIIQIENYAKDDLNKYSVAKDARNRIHFCYGQIVDLDKLDEECSVPLIEGYTIEVIERKGCDEFEKKVGDQDHFSHKFVYAVPALQNGSVCLGKIHLYFGKHNGMIDQPSMEG